MRVDSVYLRNRISAASIWALESFARRAYPDYELPPRLLPPKAAIWNPDSSIGTVEHSTEKGLYLLRSAVGSDDLAAIRLLMDKVIAKPRDRGVHGAADAAGREADVLLRHLRNQQPHTEAAIEVSEQAAVAIARSEELCAAAAALPAPEPPLRCETQWEWYPFEPGRWMAPMLSHPEALGAPYQSQCKLLENFEVFGNAPVAQWLSLAHLEDAGRTSAPALEAGARALRLLQARLPSQVPCIADLDNPRCLFHQFQYLQRGATIAAHVDAPEPPADVVATLALSGGSVRVGAAQIDLQPGDVYAISDAARWDVSHEVHASTSDRLSLTLRYAPLKALVGFDRSHNGESPSK